MNTSRTISIKGNPSSDYFKLSYYRSSEKYLKDYIDLFNPNDYYIFKCSYKQRLVTYEEFLEFKYSGYIFFKKDIYNIDHINEWIEWLGKLESKVCIRYVHKPFPPFNPDKIKIKL